MKRLPSRSLKIAAAGAAAVVLGAGGGVAAYEIASGTATQTVIRQVTVTDSQPAANSSALSVSALYDRVHKGVVTITEALSSQLDLPAGVEVTQVTPGDPADDAGLKAADATSIVGGQEFPTGGDVITAVDGKSVTTSEELQSVIGAMKPGDSASITYSRDGSEHVVQVTLGTRPS